MSASADALAGASLSPAVSDNGDKYSVCMALDALLHNADVARWQAQLSVDRRLFPEPDTLPFPSFLTHSLGAPAGGSAPAAAPTQAAARDLVPSAARASVSSGEGVRAALCPNMDDGELMGAAAPTKPSAAARAPSARALSRRPDVTSGSGSKFFTPERARAAACERWSAAAPRRQASGVPSLASLLGGATPTPGGDASAASSSLRALRNTTGSSPAASADVTGRGIASPAASRSSAAEAAAASKSAAVLGAATAPSQARTVATEKAAAAACAAVRGSWGSVAGTRKVAGCGTETDGGIKCSWGKASVASRPCFRHMENMYFRAYEYGATQTHRLLRSLEWTCATDEGPESTCRSLIIGYIICQPTAWKPVASCAPEGPHAGDERQRVQLLFVLSAKREALERNSEADGFCCIQR